MKSFAISEQKIEIAIDYAHFISPLNQDNQVKVLLKYLQSNIKDITEINNKSINAIMKVYSTNGTLLKTSSFPDGFVYNSSQPVQLATNIVDNSITSINATLQITNFEKTQSLSNPVTINLNLGDIVDK
ncbi:MAG TPA: hypothetical protein VJ767_12550 [Nitrososphaeraceae archaeon]|nr:hypothetical protein [Nitrososphaeraceae archaeon]